MVAPLLCFAVIISSPDWCVLTLIISVMPASGDWLIRYALACALNLLNLFGFGPPGEPAGGLGISKNLVLTKKSSKDVSASFPTCSASLVFYLNLSSHFDLDAVKPAASSPESSSCRIS